MGENTIYRKIVQLPSASQAKAVSFSMYSALKGKTLTDLSWVTDVSGAFRVLIAQSTSKETAWDHERSWKITRGRGRSVSHGLLRWLGGG